MQESAPRLKRGSGARLWAVKMLRFEGEYHGTGSKPSNFMRTQLYLMKWFQQYAKGRPVTQ